jgi:hypothetical protein
MSECYKDAQGNACAFPKLPQKAASRIFPSRGLLNSELADELIGLAVIRTRKKVV